MLLQRRLFIVLAAIALVALAVFAVVGIAARTEWARNVVARQVTEATGLPAQVSELHVGLLPSPTLEIRGMRLAQPPGFGDKPFVDAGRIRLRLPWHGILGASRVESLAVEDATARLVVAKNGSSNWSKLFPAPSAGASAERADWAVGKLSLERGVVEYRDASAGSEWRLTTAVDASGLAPATEFPLELRVGGVFGSHTIHYAAKGRARIEPDAGRYRVTGLDFRGWAGGDPLPLAGVELTGALRSVAYESGKGLATLEAGRFEFGGIPGRFSGTLDLDEPALAADLKVETEPFPPRAPAVAFGRPLPKTTDPAVFQSLQLAFDATTQDGVWRLDALRGHLDETNFQGTVVPVERRLRASLDRIDLNRYVPPAAKSLSTKKATLEDFVAELAKLDLDAEIRIAEAKISGVKVYDAVVRVERNGEHQP